LAHAAINVAVYGRDRSRWAMTERGRGDVERSTERLQIGPSSLRWEEDRLVVEFDELGCPIPRRVRGRVVLTPQVQTQHRVLLAEAGQHWWWPVAPRARVEVELDHPKGTWSGQAYLDSNWGAGALERSFQTWNWSRGPLGDGAVILYDVVPREGEPRGVALQIDGRGQVQDFQVPALQPLPGTFWRVDRATRSDGPATLLRTLEDTPFYTRSLIRTELGGAAIDSVHESLSLDRFDSNLVKVLLPFRMPRWAR
jgi:carotenoid 1,2-hydratase